VNPTSVEDLLALKESVGEHFDKLVDELAENPGIEVGEKVGVMLEFISKLRRKISQMVN
jgi:hypothetical protein